MTKKYVAGQGYLSANRLGSIITFAHAGMRPIFLRLRLVCVHHSYPPMFTGMTAEGDNRVLMQKVTKELLTMLRNGKRQGKCFVLVALHL